MHKKYVKKIFPFALGFLCAVSVPSFAQYNRGNINITGGVRYMNNDWKPADDETGLGIEGDFAPLNWPLNLYASYKYAQSASESVNIPTGGTVSEKSRTDELDLGVRKYMLEQGNWRPFVNAGIAILRGKLKTTGPIETIDNSDNGVGLWAGLGAAYLWNNFLNTGVQAKYTYGKVDIGGDSINAGGIQLDALVGVHW